MGDRIWRDPDQQFAWKLLDGGPTDENVRLLAAMVRTVKAARPFPLQLERWHPGCDDDTRVFVFAEGDDADADFAIERHRQSGGTSEYRLGQVRRLRDALIEADRALADRKEAS